MLLGFAEVSHADVTITPVGSAFATADLEGSWQIFRDQLLAHVPLISTVLETLKQKRSGRVKREFFIDILDENFSESEAEQQMDTVVSWGRYAHLLEYDADDERLYFPDEE